MIHMTSELYVVTAEVIGQENSQLREETDATGAFIHAFVFALDALDAGNRVKEALQEDKYDVVKIEEVIKNNNFVFDEDSDANYEELKNEAKESGDVVYGPFYIYEK